MSTNDLRTRAIVLRRTKYGETDRILNLLTPEGKKSVVAKGVRKEKSKLAGGIEMFCISDVTIHFRHNQDSTQRDALGILTSAKMSKFYSGILADLSRLELASQIIRAANRLSEQVDSPEFFSLVQQSFAALDHPPQTLASHHAAALVATWAALNLARTSGEQLNLHRDTHGDPLQPDQTYAWDSLEGALTPHPQGPISADHIKLLRLMLSAPLATVAQVQNLDRLLDDALYIARASTQNML